MTIDNQLHHAARELREVPIEAPPLPGLSAGSARRNRIPTAAVSLLMVLGGVAVWGGVSNAPTSQGDTEISSTVAVSTPVEGHETASTKRQVGPREELALIASLTNATATSFLQPPAGVV